METKSIRSLPKVFIIESLRFEDEKNGLFEGKILSEVLRLSDSSAHYVYLRTKQELEEVIDQFEDSQYRYLHFSCHGCNKGIQLTLDFITFEELGTMLGPCLENRRVFFSSCEVMQEGLASALISNTGCSSVVGPYKNINFDRAAAYWSAFYHLMLRDEAKSIKRNDLQKRTSSLQKIFGVHMRFFAKSSIEEKGYIKINLS